MTDWPRFGYDLMSSGRNAAEAGAGLGNKLNAAGGTNYTQLTLASGWPYVSTGNRPRGSSDTGGTSSPVIVGGYLYIGGEDGYFYKIDATTGALVLRYNCGTKIRSTAHVIGGVAYFGCDDGYLYAVTVSTMTLLWKSTVQAGGGVAGLCEIRSHPVVSGTRVFYGANDGKIHAALVASGAASWSFDTTIATPVPIVGALGFYNGNVHAGGGSGVYVLSAAGALVRAFQARGTVGSGVAMDTDGTGVTHCVFGSEDHMYYNYDADTGERIWLRRGSGDCFAPAAIDVVNMLVALSEHNWSHQVHRLNKGEGPFWKRDATPVPVPSGAPVAGYSIANGLLFGVWPPNDGRLAAFELVHAPGGQSAGWKYGSATGLNGAGDSTNKGYWTTPAAVNGKVYWSDEAGKVYAFS